VAVLNGREQRRVRLYGIDRTESHQEFGTRARQFTGELALGKTVTVRVRDTNRYGRTVGELILPGGRNLNQELVRAGLVAPEVCDEGASSHLMMKSAIPTCGWKRSGAPSTRSPRASTRPTKSARKKQSGRRRRWRANHWWFSNRHRHNTLLRSPKSLLGNRNWHYVPSPLRGQMDRISSLFGLTSDLAVVDPVWQPTSSGRGLPTRLSLKRHMHTLESTEFQPVR